MKFFGDWEDDYLNNDWGSTFNDRGREEREKKLERAKEIASGLTSGLFEDDEEIWDLVKKINND